MISNRFVFGNGSSVAYSYMISIAELLQEEGCLVRQVWNEEYPEVSDIICGINFSWIDSEYESIFLNLLSDNTLVIYFDEDIDITMAFNMFKEIRDKVGL